MLFLRIFFCVFCVTKKRADKGDLARIEAETPATCGDVVVKFDWVMLDDKKIYFIEAGVVAESRLGRCWFGGW